MTATEFRAANAAKAKANDKNKLEAIRNVLRTYFEVDPWTEESTGLFDDMFTADEALDEIVRILS